MDPSESERNPVEELAEEFVERYRRGERPPLREYTDRCPQHADRIRALFPALVVMEKVRPEPAEATGAAVGPATGNIPLERLGDYRILREVARGGMGIVYEAEQESLGRHVALKVLPGHALLDPRHLQRFQREARAAARLHHTNIVPVHGVGVCDGLHYYVMQFIQGQGLDEVLVELRRLRQARQGPAPDDAGRATLKDAGQAVSAVAVAQALLSGQFAAAGPQRAEPAPSLPTPLAQAGGRGEGSEVRGNSSSSEIHMPGQPEGTALSETGWPYWQSVARIGLQVADALAYATSQGVLHRDIKPSNLLLDTRGTVWVTDFGLAKAETDHDNLTHTGDIVGTLRYMAPERFQGQADVRSDLCALGLTLYELLTLRPGFDEGDRNKLIAQVMHDEPPRPRKLNPAVPRDLETVVLKAIAREPAQRYQTPQELAEDLQRFLDDRPIRARRLGPVQRGWRWCRRNPIVASLSAMVLGLLLFGAVGSTVAALILAAAHGEARQAEKNAADEAEANRKSLVRMLVATGARHLDEGDDLASFPWFVEALKRDHKDPAREAMHRVRLGAVLQQAPKLVQMWFHDTNASAAFSADGRRVVTATFVLGPVADGPTARVWDVATGKPVSPPLKHRLLGPAALSPDGSRVVTGGGDEKEGSAQVWDAQTGEAVTPPLPHAAIVRFVSFSPDGRYVLTATGLNRRGGIARVWEAATGKPVTPPLEHKPEIFSAKFSPDGRRVLTASMDGTARVWDAATGELALTLKHTHLVHDAAFSRDGSRIVTSCYEYYARVWEATTGRLVAEMKHKDWVRNADFSPDGRLVVTACDDNTARIWNAVTGAPAAPPLQHRQRVTRAAFSPDGRRIVTSSMDTTVRVWDATTGKELTAPMRHVYGVDHAAFSPDGRHVLTASRDQTVRLWDVSTGELAVTRPPDDGKANWGPISPDARLVIAIRASDHIVHIRDVATGQPVTVIPHAQKVVGYQSFSPDSRLVVTCCADGTARIWNARTGAAATALPHAGVQFASFSADGRRLVTVGTDKTVRVWNVTTGDAVGPPMPDTSAVEALSPDGRRVGGSSYDAGTKVWGAIVWDAATGELLASHRGHRDHINRVVFSPDGRRVLTSSFDFTAQLWDATTGATVAPPLRHGSWVLNAAFSPDGRRVVTGSADGTARVWDAETGQPVTPPLQHGGWVGILGWVGQVGFSPDGRYVSTVAGTAVQVWDATTGEPITPPLKAVSAPVFSADSRRVITGGGDQTVRVWSLGPIDWPLEALVLLGQLLTGRRIDDTGALVPLEHTEPSLSAQANARENLRRAWETLRAKYPRGFTPAP